MEKCVILGTGCAGLTAAVYAARANMEPVVVSGNQDGGQLTMTTDVENFPGFPEGIMGPDLINNMKKQAERFGAKFKTGICQKIEKTQNGFTLQIGEESIESQTVIVATGASARWLGLESEKEYQGKGVHTCATCDGFFYQGKEIIVVGGGDSACEEGNFLTKFASKVWLVHRRDTMRASKIMQERILSNPKVEPIWNTTIVEVKGDGKKLTSVMLKNIKTNEEKEMPIDGVFLGIGHIPNTNFLKGLCELDDHGFLKADRYMHTNVPGIFAAGDVQDTRFKQAITAAGSGCMAAMEAEKYLEGLE